MGPTREKSIRFSNRVFRMMMDRPIFDGTLVRAILVSLVVQRNLWVPLCGRAGRECSIDGYKLFRSLFCCVVKFLVDHEGTPVTRNFGVDPLNMKDEIEALLKKKEAAATK